MEDGYCSAQTADRLTWAPLTPEQSSLCCPLRSTLLVLQAASFVRSCALRFDVNPDVTQIGLVVYGGQVQTAFGLDPHLTSAVGQEPGPLPGWGGLGRHGLAAHL